MKNTEVVGLRARLEEKIKTLEKERALLLEEIAQLKEVVELHEKAKKLEEEVDKLKLEAKALREKLPSRLFREPIEVYSSESADVCYEEDSDECDGCQQQEEELC